MNHNCEKECKHYPCGDPMAYPGNCKDFEEIEIHIKKAKKLIRQLNESRKIIKEHLDFRPDNFINRKHN